MPRNCDFSWTIATVPNKKKKVFGVRGATTLRQLSTIDSLSITGEHMHFAAMSVFLVVAISWCSYHDPFVSG